MHLIAAATLMPAAAAGAAGQRLLFDIVVTLGVAMALAALLRRVGQGAIVGYLLAGVLVGPGALGLVRDLDTFSAMGEIGIALLLFTIGLELPWRSVGHLGRHALVAGFLQVALTVTLAVGALVALGAAAATAVVIAMAISLSSTAVVMRVLADRAETDSVHGLNALGVLLAQDIAVVAFLLVVPELADGGGAAGIALGFVASVGKLVGLVAVMYVLEFVVMRRLFHGGALGGERELLAVSSIAVSLGAVGACQALGLSPALGGFVAGMLMADAPYAVQVRAEIASIRTALVALFFAWVGMLANVEWILMHAGRILVVVAAVVVGKAIVGYVALRIMRVAAYAAGMAAVSIAQLGEFSLALLGAARAGELVDASTFQLWVSVSLVTLLATPSLIALASRVIHRPATGAAALAPAAIGTLAAAARLPHDAEHPRPVHERRRRDGHVVVVGYGPSGRGVVAALTARDVPVTIIELNPRLREATGGNIRVVFGDAVRPEVLEDARAAQARLIVITIPEPANLRRMVRHVALVAPGVPIIARGRYHIYVPQIHDAGATAVVDEETVTGRELAAVALEHLGID